MKTIKREFRRETVTLDFHEYHDCTFVECEMVYYGHTLPELHNCNWQDCKWSINPPAANGIHLLSLLKNSGNAGMAAIATEMLRNARLI